MDRPYLESRTIEDHLRDFRGLDTYLMNKGILRTTTAYTSQTGTRTQLT